MVTFKSLSDPNYPSGTRVQRSKRPRFRFPKYFLTRNSDSPGRKSSWNHLCVRGMYSWSKKYEYIKRWCLWNRSFWLEIATNGSKWAICEDFESKLPIAQESPIYVFRILSSRVRPMHIQVGPRAFSTRRIRISSQTLLWKTESRPFRPLNTGPWRAVESEIN